MKSLISVTPREFKRNFNEVMETCTDMCMTTNQEIIITVPSRKSNTHAEIAKLVPVENGKGIKYEYNKELMDKHGIKKLKDMIGLALPEGKIHLKRAVKR